MSALYFDLQLSIITSSSNQMYKFYLKICSLHLHFRQKAFWVAKQILQLGMGDAFDDWLIEKIQLLRKGSVVASGIKRIEQVVI